MINALLVRWSGGWSEVTDTTSIGVNGRREALLGLGAVQSLPELQRIAGEQLAIYADVRTQITVDLEPITAAEVPEVGDTVTVPDIGGTPTVERVIARTFSEDDDGVLTYAVDIKDVILSAQERHEQAVKKMSDGTLRGASKVATPVGQFWPSPESCCVPEPSAEWTYTVTGSSISGADSYSLGSDLGVPYASTAGMTLVSATVTATGAVADNEDPFYVALHVDDGEVNWELAVCDLTANPSGGTMTQTDTSPLPVALSDAASVIATMSTRITGGTCSTISIVATLTGPGSGPYTDSWS